MNNTWTEQHTRILHKSRALLRALLLIRLDPADKETIVCLRLIALFMEMDMAQMDRFLAKGADEEVQQHIDFFLADLKGGR